MPTPTPKLRSNAQAIQIQPSAAILEALFNQVFERSLQTKLVGGCDEPFYQAKAPNDTHHVIYYTYDYASSALHEIAHWCVAGEKRRQLDDYGYWYSPDGRSPEQQAEFEKVEVKPQALEWIFSKACDMVFQVSADNLTLGCGPSEAFKQAIHQQACAYLNGEMNTRALQFLQVLEQNFHNGQAVSASSFLLSDLR